MTLFKFTANAVIEATSEEDALNKLGANFSRVARHVGNGSPFAATQPFFSLAEVAKGEPVDLIADHIIAEKGAYASETADETADGTTAPAETEGE